MSEVNLSTDETRVSYGIGRQLGDQLRDNPPPGVSLDAILAGLTDAFAGKPSRVDQEQMAASFKVIREIMQAEAAAKAEAAAGEGLAFLAENAKRDGITTLASGLQFEVLTAGDGAKPTREDQVRTHYHGTLIDGTVFDSSYERGQPAEFPVGGVIAGWTPAGNLQLDFFHESSPAPHRETYLIKADGSRELASSLSGNVVTREKELGVVLALSTARALHVLLGEQLEQLATRNLMTGPASGNG